MHAAPLGVVANWASMGYAAPPPVLLGHASVGWTSPTFTYDLMRHTNASADDLDNRIDEHINVDDPFRAAWKKWHDTEWKPFFEKYAGPNSSQLSKLGVVLDTDALYRQAEYERGILDDMHRTYLGKRGPDGRPLPPPAVSPPARVLPPTDVATPTFQVPWWAWLLGGVALVGAGYYAYRRYLAPGGRDMGRRDASRDPELLPPRLRDRRDPYAPNFHVRDTHPGASPLRSGARGAPSAAPDAGIPYPRSIVDYIQGDKGRDRDPGCGCSAVPSYSSTSRDDDALPESYDDSPSDGSYDDTDE